MFVVFVTFRDCILVAACLKRFSHRRSSGFEDLPMLSKHTKSDAGRRYSPRNDYRPLDEENRKARIAQFAKEYDFKLSFYKEGLCAIFEKDSPRKRQ
jgi:hypothetical protein